MGASSSPAPPSPTGSPATIFILSPGKAEQLLPSCHCVTGRVHDCTSLPLQTPQLAVWPGEPVLCAHCVMTMGAAQRGVPSLQNVPRGCRIRSLPEEKKKPQGTPSLGPRGNSLTVWSLSQLSSSLNLLITNGRSKTHFLKQNSVHFYPQETAYQRRSNTGVVLSCFQAPACSKLTLYLEHKLGAVRAQTLASQPEPGARFVFIRTKQNSNNNRKKAVSTS